MNEDKNVENPTVSEADNHYADTISDLININAARQEPLVTTNINPIEDNKPVNTIPENNIEKPQETKILEEKPVENTVQIPVTTSIAEEVITPKLVTEKKPSKAKFFVKVMLAFFSLVIVTMIGVSGYFFAINIIRNNTAKDSAVSNQNPSSFITIAPETLELKQEKTIGNFTISVSKLEIQANDYKVFVSIKNNSANVQKISTKLYFSLLNENNNYYLEDNSYQLKPEENLNISINSGETKIGAIVYTVVEKPANLNLDFFDYETGKDDKITIF